MKLPLEVTFRNMDPSAALEDAIRNKSDKLERLSDDIMACRVVVEASHRHHHKGNVYHVRIDLTLPGRELVVSRESGANHAHEDPYVAVRDAFAALQRQLDAFVHKRRQDVKTHELPPHGRISALTPMLDSGTIETADGRMIYFHRNAVVNADYDKLEEGMSVRFHEEQGEKGPQASSVIVEGKHHVVG